MALTPVPSINLESLPMEAISLIETLAGRAQEADRLEQENRLLREMIRIMRLEKYGPKSEKLSDEQLGLLELEPGVHAQEVASEAAVFPEQKRVKKREHAGRNALPSHLPRREEILAVEGEERLCVCCGEERCLIGYEEKEVLDLEPARYFVRVIKREKLACRKCPEGGVATAEGAGPHIVEKGKLSDALVVDVVIKKYGSHLPLYRQQADLERDYNIELSRSTLNAAVMAAGELLLPVVSVMKGDLLEGGYIQADETPIGVQSKETKGRNHQGYEFQYSRPGGPVVFDFRMSRAREGPAEFLGAYDGILQCDGYQGYEKIGAPGMVRAGCLAHARRKFNDALKVNPQDREAAAVLGAHGQTVCRGEGSPPRRCHPGTTLEDAAGKKSCPLRGAQNQNRADRSPRSSLEQTGRGLPVRPQPVAALESFSGRWPHRDRPESVRERHASRCHRSQKLAAHRERGGRSQNRCHPLDHGDVQAP